MVNICQHDEGSPAAVELKRWMYPAFLLCGFLGLSKMGDKESLCAGRCLSATGFQPPLMPSIIKATPERNGEIDERFRFGQPRVIAPIMFWMIWV